MHSGSRIATMTDASIWLTGDAEADQLLTDDDNALLIGMILDQQVPMEKAFGGPLVIAERMGGKWTRQRSPPCRRRISPHCVLAPCHPPFSDRDGQAGAGVPSAD